MSNSLSIGIIGLPNVGKSTMFNALTNNNVLAANYPFATIEPNTGIVPVPDSRLRSLADIYNTEKIIPSTVTFVDIAGLVEGASKGEGLGNKFLSHIRDVNAIIHIIRAFDDSKVSHISSEFNPKRDIDIINTELVLADLNTINNRIDKLKKEMKAEIKLKSKYDLLIKIQEILNNNQLLNTHPELDLTEASDLHLLTSKPVIYLFNIDENDLNNSDKRSQLATLVEPAKVLFACAKLESELQDLNDDEKEELLNSYNQEESSLNLLITEAYKILGLQSFLTAGEKEVRAWTIRKGSKAPQAAGVIHNDFEKGFISAEVVSYPELIEAGSYLKAKSNGKVRTEGKEYVMQPEDIVLFRFNINKR